MRRLMLAATLAALVASPAIARDCLKESRLGDRVDLERAEKVFVGTWPAVNSCQAWAIIDGDVVYAQGPFGNYDAAYDREPRRVASDGSVSVTTAWGAEVTLYEDGRVRYKDKDVFWGEVHPLDITTAAAE